MLVRMGGNKASRGKFSRTAQNQLLASGQKLFAAKGFDGTTVRELSEVAGVNQSLVSYHFGGKEGLYRAVINRFGQMRLSTAQRLLKAPDSFEEVKLRLKMFIEEILSFHLSEPELTQIIHKECENAAPLAPDIFRQTFLKVFETLVEFLSDAQKRGMLREDFDPMIVSNLFFGSMMHLIHRDSISKKYFQCTIADETYRQRVTDQLLQLLLEGCKKHESP
jgi:TetR/AcrR family transcriptional regulator